MKNLFLTVAAVVALTFTLASCKKDRTCICTDADGETQNYTAKKVTKKFMRDEADCVTSTEVYSDGSTYTETCELD